MTVRELLAFDCKICHRTFLMYCYGHYINYCHEGLCFYDNILGEIHDNHYLNAVTNKRKCRTCSKSNQLEEFII